MKIVTKMNNPITSSKGHRVSNLVLNDNLSFKQHLKRLVEIDRINDRNAKKLYKSKEDLYAWVNSRNELEKILGQLTTYIHLSQKELSQKEFKKNLAEVAKASKQINKVFVDEQKIIYKHKKEIMRFLNSSLLQKYKRWFYTKFFSREDHKIDEYEQRAINEIHGTKLVDDLFLASMKGDFAMPLPEDVNGNKVKGGCLGDWLHSDDYAVRHSAWMGYINFLCSKMSAMSEMIKIKIYRAWQEAGFSEYKSIFEKNMHMYEITPEIGQKIFESCKYCQKEFSRFLDFNDKAIAAQVHCTEIEPWDREKGLILDEIRGLTKQEIKQDVLNALRVMDPRYQVVLNKVFDENWIDWKHKPEDQNENCSFTCKGNAKYPIRVFFDGTASAAITLAHEIGHSVNAEITSKNNAYEGCNDLLSEIPSFVNETIMYLYYLNAKYKDNANNEHMTLSYQLMKRLYENICENTILMLTNNKLEKELISTGNLYTKQILGTFREIKDKFGVLLDADKKWMKEKSLMAFYDIPALQNIFGSIGDHQTLVYFLGATIGVCIGFTIVNGGKEIAKKYYDFLLMGRTKDPIAALKTIGFDVTKQETFKPLIIICKQLVDELQRYRPVQRPIVRKRLVYKNKPSNTTKKLIK